MQLGEDQDGDRQRTKERMERFAPIFITSPSWKFDLYETPALMLNNDTQSILLVLVDLRRKKVTSSIMLDINEAEYKFLFRDRGSVYVPPGKTVEEALEEEEPGSDDEADFAFHEPDCPSLEVVASSELYL